MRTHGEFTILEFGDGLAADSRSATANEPVGETHIEVLIRSRVVLFVVRTACGHGGRRDPASVFKRLHSAHGIAEDGVVILRNFPDFGLLCGLVTLTAPRIASTSLQLAELILERIIERAVLPPLAARTFRHGRDRFNIHSRGAGSQDDAWALLRNRVYDVRHASGLSCFCPSSWEYVRGPRPNSRQG